MTTEAQTIEPARFARGRRRRARLDDGHDARHQVDLRRPRRVARPTPEQRDRILGNVLYKYISTSLAGTQEYMAMEKLYAVQERPELRPHPARHAAHGERARLPRRARAPRGRHRQRRDALVRAGLPELRQALAQPAGALDRRGAAGHRQADRRRLPRADGGVHQRDERGLRRLEEARRRGGRRRSAAPTWPTCSSPRPIRSACARCCTSPIACASSRCAATRSS